MSQLRDVYQAGFTHQTYTPKHKLSIGIPVLSNASIMYMSPSYSLKEIQNSNQEVSINKLFATLNDRNVVRFNLETDIFHIRKKIRNYVFDFNISNKFHYKQMFPRDFYKLMTFQYVDETGRGQKLDISGLDWQLTHYNQYALGAVKLGPVWSYGVRAKFLQGLSHVQLYTKDNQVNIDPDFYDINIQNPLILRSSLPSALDTSGIEPFSAGDYLGSFKNKGFATDFSGSYQFRRQHHFYATLNNIGFIVWTNNPTAWQTSKDLKIDGANYDQFSSNGLTDSFGDTLIKKYFPERRNLKRYTTWLTPQLLLSYRYEVASFASLQASMSIDYYKQFWPGLMLGADVSMKRYITIAPNISYRYNQFNVGFGAVVKPGPLQFFVATDNIIGIIAPADTYYTTLRFGMNIVLKKIGPQQQQMTDKSQW